MTDESQWFTAEKNDNGLSVRLDGDWSIGSAAAIDRALSALDNDDAAHVVIDAGTVERLDTAGAWLIERTRRRLEERGATVEIRADGESQDILIERLEKLAREEPPRPERHARLPQFLYHVGELTVAAAKDSVGFLAFLGAATVATGRALRHPRRIRRTAFVAHLQSSGLNAMPIVGLLSFVIGVVLAYQGADQLRRFGAEIFTVDLLGISILREMAVLMAAIIIAGRSGSAYTAQIGTMQVNEEIDAMRTIGLDPMEVLVLPRAFALFIALPLLVIYADFMGLLGGAVMAVTVLEISPEQFIRRLQEVVPLSAFWIGLVKAPVFGLTIALIGCREGLKVSGSAESVGRQTTRSVVIAIFLVMVLDAVFSVFFSTVGI